MRIERAAWQLRVGDWWMDADELRTYFMPPQMYAALAAMDPPPTKEELDYLVTTFGQVSPHWRCELSLLLHRRETRGVIIRPDYWGWWRERMILKEPKQVKWENGSSATAYAEFNGGNSVLVVDDGCWLLMNRGSNGFAPAAWIFPEAMTVLRQLPDDPRNYEPYRKAVGMTPLPKV